VCTGYTINTFDGDRQDEINTLFKAA